MIFFFFKDTTKRKTARELGRLAPDPKEFAKKHTFGKQPETAATTNTWTEEIYNGD